MPSGGPPRAPEPERPRVSLEATRLRRSVIIEIAFGEAVEPIVSAAKYFVRKLVSTGTVKWFNDSGFGFTAG
jgi:hypothetical protein